MQLAGTGYWVIRYDYRDVGLSTRLDELGVPDIGQLQEAISSGRSVQAPYTLRDMALDLVGLMDALTIESAHLAGRSMGTGIAALVAIHHPQRVRSLILLGATTDDPMLPPPPPEILSVLLKPTPSDRDGYIESSVEKDRALHGTGLPFDERRARAQAGRFFDRGLYPDGRTRQLAANLATGSMKEQVKSITAPTLVISGSHDPFGLEHGVDTAETIPGAELLIIQGMGHSIALSRAGARKHWALANIARVEANAARLWVCEAKAGKRSKGAKAGQPPVVKEVLRGHSHRHGAYE